MKTMEKAKQDVAKVQRELDEIAATYEALDHSRHCDGKRRQGRRGGSHERFTPFPRAGKRRPTARTAPAPPSRTGTMPGVSLVHAARAATRHRPNWN